MHLLQELCHGEGRVVIVCDNARSHADPSTSRITTEQHHPQSPCRWQSSPLASPRLKNSPDAVKKDGIPTLQSLSSLMMMPPVRQQLQYDRPIRSDPYDLYDRPDAQPEWPANETNCTSDLLSEFLRISTDDLTLYHTDDEEDKDYEKDVTFATTTTTPTKTTSLTLTAVRVPTYGHFKSTSMTLPSLSTWPSNTTADTTSSNVTSNVKKPVRRRSLDLNQTNTGDFCSHPGHHGHHYLHAGGPLSSSSHGGVVGPLMHRHAALPTSSAHV